MEEFFLSKDKQNKVGVKSSGSSYQRGSDNMVKFCGELSSQLLLTAYPLLYVLHRFCDKNSCSNLWLNIKNRCHKFYTKYYIFMSFVLFLTLCWNCKRWYHYFRSASISHTWCKSCLEFDNNVGLNHGQFYTLMFILRNNEDQSFSYFQTSSPLFVKQLNLVSNHLTKQDARLKLTISAED